jgi:hypothetical protein
MGTIRFFNFNCENLSLTFENQVQGGLIFGVVHLYAICFFAGPNILTIAKAGLHQSQKQAGVKALLLMNLAFGPG